MTKVVAAWVRAAEKKGADHNKRVQITCANPDGCPLLAVGKCQHVRWAQGLLTDNPCPYGGHNVIRGLTHRARSAASEVAAWRAANDEALGGKPSAAAWHGESLCVIGDWVFLPYPHMGLVGSKREFSRRVVPWRKPKGYFDAGEQWIKVDDFTPEVVTILGSDSDVDVPRTLMEGAPIRGYRENILPRFVYDVSWVMPYLYVAACEIDPTLKTRRAGLNVYKDDPVRLDWLRSGIKVKQVGDQKIAGTVTATDRGWSLAVETDQRSDVLNVWRLREGIDKSRGVEMMIPLHPWAQVVPDDPDTIRGLWETGYYCDTLRFLMKGKSDGVNRVHGWFDSVTRKLTQVG